MGKREQHEAKRLKVKKAAIMKAKGGTWDEVAAALSYSSGDTARHVLQRDRDLWRQEYLNALDDYLAQDVEPIAVQMQLDLMKLAATNDLGDRRLAEAAAHSLLLHTAKLKTMRLEVAAKRAPQEADEELMRTLIESSNVACDRIVAEHEAERQEREALQEELRQLRAQITEAKKALPAPAEVPV